MTRIEIVCWACLSSGFSGQFYRFRVMQAARSTPRLDTASMLGNELTEKLAVTVGSQEEARARNSRIFVWWRITRWPI
jgi:hypothetical protein